MGADLPQEVGATWSPGPLVLLAEAWAAHLIHRRFHTARADAVAVPVTLSGVGTAALLVLNGWMEFLDGVEQLTCGGMAIVRHGGIAVHLPARDHLQRLVDVPMPQKPRAAFSFPHDWITPRLVLFLSPGLLWQAFRGLLEHGEPQRHREPIEEVLGVWVQRERALAHRGPTISEKGNRLVELMAL
jgi:hypothetical protein